MHGKIVKKQNNWFVRAVEQGRELDEIKFEYYPIAFSESREIELKEGKEVEFEIRNVNYIDADGLGQELIKFAVIL
jgi:hypothetical protein